MATDEQNIERALREAGCNQTNAKFRFSFVYGTSEGTFTVAVNGQQTSDVDYPPSAAQLKEALEAVSTVDADGVNVRGPLGGPYELEFVGANAGQEVPLPVVDGSSLTPSQEVIVEEIQQGDSTDYQAFAEQYWADYFGAVNETLRLLYVERDLLKLRLGPLSEETDVQIGRDNEVEEAGSKRFEQARALYRDVLAAIESEIGKLGAFGGKRALGARMTQSTPNGAPYGVFKRNAVTGRLY